MKNSENKTELYLFLNVFDVTPTFLLPVFTDRTRFFFQEIENDAIKSFSEADMDYFSDCPQIRPISNDVYSVGESAIYAVQFPDGRFISGNSKTLLAYLNEEKALIDRFPVFKENVQEFQKQIYKNETLTISSQPQITENEIKVKVINTLRKIIDNKRNSFEDYFAQLNVLFPSLRENLIKDISFGMYPQALNSLYLAPYTSNIISKNSNFSFKKMLYENEDYAIYYQNKDEVMANNIFQLYDVIMAQCSSVDGINPIIKYKKENSISVKQQLQVIDILLHCTPASHKKILRYIRDDNKFYGKQVYGKLNKLQGRLWTYNHLRTLHCVLSNH